MNLVSQSGKLLHTLSQEVHDLEEIMDKKIGTVGSGLGYFFFISVLKRLLFGKL